jgi:FkbM family methyltransferase
METFSTKYGLVSLLENDIYFINEFRQGLYWDEDTILKLKEYIDPNRDILEIGAHCGTSTILYSSFLHDSRRVFAYEPQKNMYTVLLKNIEQNGLQSKVIPYNSAVFCYEGPGEMHSMDLDGGGPVAKAYSEASHNNFNFGGLGIGQDGEEVTMRTIDTMGLDNIGFIHCDAQGAENYIFSKGIDTIRKCRPVIFYENNFAFAKHYYDNISNTYPEYKEEGLFDVSRYCMDTLGYSECIHKFNGGIDTLLIP